MNLLDLLKEHGWCFFFLNRNMADFSEVPLDDSFLCLHRWSLLSILITSLYALDHPWVHDTSCITTWKLLEKNQDTLVTVQWAYTLPHSHFEERMPTVLRLSGDRSSQVGTDDLKDGSSVSGKTATSNTPNPHPCIFSNTVFSLTPTVLSAVWTSTLNVDVVISSLWATSALSNLLLGCL